MQKIKQYFVYKHTNLINGKVYIGQTCQSLNSRWGRSGQNYKSAYFKSAIQHYGWDNFTHEILASGLTAEKANELEIYYISYYRSNENSYGYNINLGGNDKTVTEYTRQLQSAAALARKTSVSPETKLKLSICGKNKVITTDTKLKFSKAAVLREQNKKELNIHKYRKVICVTTGIIFDSVILAAKWCGLAGGSGIAIACANPKKSAGGHPDTKVKLHWAYL